MPRATSREEAQRFIDVLLASGGDRAKACESLGISRFALHRGLKRAAQFGLIPRDIPSCARPPDGFVITERTARYGAHGELQRQTIKTALEAGENYAIPSGHIVKGESAFVDQDGNLIGKWIKTREGRDPSDVIAVLRAGLADLPTRHEPTHVPEHSRQNLLTLYPWGDWHMGMHSWHRETGTNWDLDIAERVIGAAAIEAIERSPPSAMGVVLGGGDLLHSDSNQNRTERSGHALDVDGRHDKVLRVTQRLIVRTVEAALARHETVLIRFLKGNHDEYSAAGIAYFLEAWFRNDPRVFVDTDPSLFWWHRFGGVLLGATHGHTVKIDQMPAIMAHRRASDWGETRFRYVHGFHLHHKQRLATEGMGVICEVHQAPIPQDAWHFASGFLSGRSLETVTYDAGLGEVSRQRVAILDG